MWLWIVVGVVGYAVLVAAMLGIMRAATAADHTDRSVFREWASSSGQTAA